MMVVVFRARRTPEGDGEEYMRRFQRMSELARAMPGYLSHKGFVAEDGERLTLFEWETADTLRAWATPSRTCPRQAIRPREILHRISSAGLRIGARI